MTLSDPALHSGVSACVFDNAPRQLALFHVRFSQRGLAISARRGSGGGRAFSANKNSDCHGAPPQCQNLLAANQSHLCVPLCIITRAGSREGVGPPHACTRDGLLTESLAMTTGRVQFAI